MSTVEERVWRWNVDVVSVAGRLGNLVVEGERATFFDVQRECRRSLDCFASPVQKWFVGSKRCVPMRELASVLTPGEVVSIVTVVHSDHRACRACSARGLFGRQPLLRWCSRCRDAAYCSTMCQKIDWQRHRKTCVPLLPDDAAEDDSIHARDEQERGTLNRHYTSFEASPTTRSYVAKYCSKPERR